MKQITIDNLTGWTFEDSEAETAAEFRCATVMNQAYEYLVDRALDGVISQLSKDINAGTIVSSKMAPNNPKVLEILIEVLSELMVKYAGERELAWNKIHALGLPKGDWTYNLETKFFYKPNGEKVLNEQELNLVRQWFNVIEDALPEYFQNEDRELAAKLFPICSFQTAKI